MEIVSVKTSKDDVFKVEQLIESINIKFPNLNIGRKVVNENKLDVSVTFEVHKIHYEIVARIFLTNQLEVRPLNEDQKDIIRDINQQIFRASKASAAFIEKLKVKRHTLTIPELIDFALAGDYDKVLEVAQDVNLYGTELVQKARELMPETAAKAIEQVLIKANLNLTNAEIGVKALIKIGSDQILRSNGKNDILWKAGYSAIFLCTKYSRLRPELVNICNNSKLHNLVNLKAAVTISRMLTSGNEQMLKDISDEIKNINIRFLVIAGDVAYSELNSEEKKLYDLLIEKLRKKEN